MAIDNENLEMVKNAMKSLLVHHDHHQGGVAVGEQGGDQGRPAARHQRGVRRGCGGVRSSKSLSSSAIPLSLICTVFGTLSRDGL